MLFVSCLRFVRGGVHDSCFGLASCLFQFTLKMQKKNTCSAGYVQTYFDVKGNNSVLNSALRPYAKKKSSYMPRFKDPHAERQKKTFSMESLSVTTFFFQ